MATKFKVIRVEVTKTGDRDAYHRAVRRLIERGMKCVPTELTLGDNDYWLTICHKDSGDEEVFHLVFINTIWLQWHVVAEAEEE